MDSIRFSFAGDRALAAVTGREGGVSQGELASLNLSFEVGDDPARVVIANRKIAGDDLGFDFRALVVPRQVHGVRVKVIGDQDRGRGANSSESGVAACDALVTTTPMVPLAVLVADCAPVVLYDPAQPAIGIVHVGWRGAIGRIVQKAVETMARDTRLPPARHPGGHRPMPATALPGSLHERGHASRGGVSTSSRQCSTTWGTNPIWTSHTWSNNSSSMPVSGSRTLKTPEWTPWTPSASSPIAANPARRDVAWAWPCCEPLRRPAVSLGSTPRGS